VNHKDWRKRAKVRHATLENATRMVQNILFDGAMGISEAYGPGLRALELTHKVMQPTKDEQKGYGIGGPTLPKFNRSGQPTSSPGAEAAPAEAWAVLDASGQPYVETE
jgi:hypothetical protein